jgi:hypothetical protein
VGSVSTRGHEGRGRVEVKDVWKLGSIGMMTQGGGGKPRLKTVKPRLKMVSGSRVIAAP